MLKSIKTLLVLFSITLIIYSCKDSDSNTAPTNLGRIEMKIGSSTWISSSSAAYAGGQNDSSALIIAGVNLGSEENPTYEAISIYAINTVSENLVGEYPFIIDSEDEVEEIEITRGAFIIYTDSEENLFLSTSGSLKVLTASKGRMSGTFLGVLTQIEEDEEDVIAAFKANKIPKVKLGHKQLNVDLTLSDGAFYLNYSNQLDFED